jgi:DnaJ family protein C protein 9
LQKAYEILSNPKKRERYDRFGDDGSGEGAFTSDEWMTAYEYYRAANPPLTKQDIKSFAERYKHGKEEEADLIKFYEDNEGDMKALLESIMLSTNDDLERFIKFFEEKIHDKTLPTYKKFNQTKTKVKLLPTDE